MLTRRQHWAVAVVAGLAMALLAQGPLPALADIRESIGELRHYRDTFLRLP